MNREPRKGYQGRRGSSEAIIQAPDRATVLRRELAERADAFFQGLEDYYFRDDGDEIDEKIGAFLQEQRSEVKRAIEKEDTRNPILTPFMLLAACYSDSLRARGRHFVPAGDAPAPRDIVEGYFLYVAKKMFSERMFTMDEVATSLGDRFIERLPEALREESGRRVSELGLQGVISLTPEQVIRDPRRALAEVCQLKSEGSFYGFVKTYLERELLPGLTEARRAHDDDRERELMDQMESLARIFWRLVKMEETLNKAVQRMAPRAERLPIHRYHLPRGVRLGDVFAVVYAPYGSDTCRAISDQFFQLDRGPYVCTYTLNEYTETGARIPTEKIVRVWVERGTLVVEGEIDAKQTGIENIGAPDLKGSPDLHELKIVIPANWIVLDDNHAFVFGEN